MKILVSRKNKFTGCHKGDSVRLLLNQFNKIYFCIKSCFKVGSVTQTKIEQVLFAVLTGGQLAKMKKSIPDMSLP